MAQKLKHLPSVRETRVWSLGREDPLEKEIVTHSSILACIQGSRGALQATVHRVAKSRTRLSHFTSLLQKTLESPLDCKVVKQVNSKGNQHWIFIVSTVAEAEAPILWPPDAKSQLIGKDPDTGKDWGQEKGETEDEIVGWYHRLNGHEFEQTLGDNRGQRNLACYSPWGYKSWTKLNDLITEQQHNVD